MERGEGKGEGKVVEREKRGGREEEMVKERGRMGEGEGTIGEGKGEKGKGEGRK